LDTSILLKAFSFIVGLGAGFLVLKLLDRVLTEYIEKVTVKYSKFKGTYLFAKRVILAVVGLFGVGVVTYSVLPGVSRFVASFIFAAGFVSIVIGMAAQSSFSNVIAGMLLATTRPFNIGDAVVFRSDFGFVEDLALTFTGIRTWDNRRLVIPNSIFQSEVTTNYIGKDPMMLAPFFVQVSYESDIEKALKILVEVAEKHPECVKVGNLPNAVVMELGDSAVTLRGLSAAKDQPTAFMMIRDLLLETKKRFDKNGIEIPYPRRYIVPDRRLWEKIKDYNP